MTLPSEPETQDEPTQLRFLRRLVTTLTVIMVGGVLVVISLLVIRLSQTPPEAQPALTLPEQITLPEGVKARAITFGDGWIAVVTQDNRILILDPQTSELRQSVKIK